MSRCDACRNDDRRAQRPTCSARHGLSAVFIRATTSRSRAACIDRRAAGPCKSNDHAARPPCRRTSHVGDVIANVGRPAATIDRPPAKLTPKTPMRPSRRQRPLAAHPERRVLDPAGERGRILQSSRSAISAVTNVPPGEIARELHQARLVDALGCEPPPVSSTIGARDASAHRCARIGPPRPGIVCRLVNGRAPRIGHQAGHHPCMPAAHGRRATRSNVGLSPGAEPSTTTREEATDDASGVSGERPGASSTPREEPSPHRIRCVITIDGPSGAGKGTVAREGRHELGYGTRRHGRR